jgi:hypothetical protein
MSMLTVPRPDGGVPAFLAVPSGAPPWPGVCWCTTRWG